MKKQGYDQIIKKIKSTKNIRKIFSDYIILSKEVLLEFNDQKNPEYYQIIFQNLIQRLYLGIMAIDTLFDKFSQINYFKYPIAIQMRACILDSLTIAYLTQFIDPKDPKIFKEQIQRLNQPSARELNDEIESNIKNSNIKSSECHDSFKLALSLYPDNFTKGSIPKLKKINDIKLKDMVATLKGTQLEYFNEIYKIYRHYSKYEHYGTLSKILLEFDSEYEFDKITFSTRYVVQATLIAFIYMKIDSEKIEKLKHIKDRILEFNKIS